MNAKPVRVFYAGLLYGEYDEWPKTHTLPDGAYVWEPDDREQYWYLIRHSSAMPINLCDVPAQLRTIMLLLN